MHSLHLKGVLIFDSNPGHARDYPTKSSLSALEIIHSPINLEGDLYILEYLTTLKNPSHIQLVTSDKALSLAAKALHVTSLSSTEFFSLLSSKSSTKNALRKELKPLFDSKKELDRIQKLFEDRL